MEILPQTADFKRLIENIPQNLKARRLWCCWKFEDNPDGGKPKKVPWNPVTNKRARINDLATLCSFAECVAGVQSGRFDGLNYAFGHDDFIGLDLDGVLVEGILEEWAAEVMRLFESAGTYMELSPSGRGLRILCKGSLPRFGKGWGDFNRLEAYGRGAGGLHFLSITGNALNAVEALPDCQGALDWVYSKYLDRPEKPAVEAAQSSLEPSPELDDSEVLELARRAKNGAEFSKLYAEGSGGDHSSDDLRLCSILAFYTQDAGQLDGLFRQSALMRDKWERPDYRNATIAKALEGLTAVYQPRAERQGGSYGLTEREAARRFLESQAAENFRIDRKCRTPKIMAYNGAIWSQDGHAHKLLNTVGGVAKTVLAEMVDEPSQARRDGLYALAKKLETKRGLSDITELVKIGLEGWESGGADSHDDLLCLANGVLYLSGGALLPHGAGWHFTRQSLVKFDEAAECPNWLNFIREFCCEDLELVRFLQVWLGYCLSGETSEHKLAVFYGHGCNGKSVLLNTVSHVLGGFAGQTPADTLLQRRNESSNDLAALEGLRFVVASESDDFQALAEGRVKAITGGDQVVCRKLFEEFGSYVPRFKLNLATNHKPRVSGSDVGIWRRLLLIPCNAAVIAPDKRLPDKLNLEASGVLNWMLAGYKIWAREGLALPRCVLEATEEYRTESDTIGRFLDEVCNPYLTGLRPDGLKASNVYADYRKWAEENGQKPLASYRFGQKMAEKGWQSTKKKDGLHYPWGLTERR